MRTNDLDREIINQNGDFILGTSLAGWVLGLALCTTILMLAAAPTPITQVFALGTLISTLVLSAWLARRLRKNH
jgi:hypothetical protein|nr:MAG TPA: hypothetical protein [Caudoviricetes sp.]